MFEHQRILIITPARLGDTVFCTLAIHALWQLCPQTQFDALAITPLSAEVLAHNPALGTIHCAPAKAELSELAKHYQGIINLHQDEATHAYAQQLALPSYAIWRSLPSEHEAAQKLRFIENLLQAKLAPEHNHYFLYPQSAHFQKINQLLTDVKPQQLLIGMHLGCHGLAKRSWKLWQRFKHQRIWPLDNYIQVARQLQKLYPHIRIVLTGSKAETALAQRFCHAIPGTINLTNQTSVLELAALMSRLNLLLTGNTGVLHVACASTVDIIALFDTTFIAQASPYPPATHRLALVANSTAEHTVDNVLQAMLHSPRLAKHLQVGE